MRSTAASSAQNYQHQDHQKQQQQQQQQRRDDDMRTFGLLQEEKKRLLDSIDQLRNKQVTTNEAGEKVQQQQQQQQQQLRQQMNDFNRRQHAVVQRMSAYDRYKRKKWTIRATHKAAATSTTAKRVDDQSHTTTITTTREGTTQAVGETKTAELTAHNVNIIIKDDTKTQSDEESVPKPNGEIAREVNGAVQRVPTAGLSPAGIIFHAVHMGRQKLAAIDTHLDECMEMAELLESGRYESSDDEDDAQEGLDLEWKQLKKEIKQVNKLSAAEDERYIQSKRRTDEFLARNATTTTTTTTSRPQPARAAQSRIFEKQELEIREFEKQMYKTMEEHHRYLEWYAKYPLVVRRRANQSANAGWTTVVFLFFFLSPFADFTSFLLLFSFYARFNKQQQKQQKTQFFLVLFIKLKVHLSKKHWFF